jgi:tetratricopeptide (TPR) repeat protein
MNNFIKALTAFENANRIDPSPAILHFEIGRCYLTLGDSVRAKQSFERARDFDPVRFRATSEFNQIIKKLSQENHIPMIDMEAIFSAFSPFQIIGNELVAEHLHPNFRGYFLMAKSFSQSIIEYNFLNTRALNLDLDDDDFLEFSGVTISDQAIGDFSIQKLTSGWPYDHQISVMKYKNIAVKQFVESIVSDYSCQKISWNEAHYRLADYFSSVKLVDLAIKEYQSVIKVLPENYFPYFKIANLYFIENKQDEAEAWFKKALQLNNDAAFIHAKLGMVYIVKRNLNAAIKYFQQALKFEEQKAQLSDKEKVYCHYYLAACLIETDYMKEAKAQLEKLLEIDPGHKKALALLSLMDQNKKIHIQF